MLAFKTAFRSGIQPDSFWSMTPNELKLCVEAQNDQTLAERERDMWWAWHVAFLHRVDVKHFPKLTDLIKGLKPRPTGDVVQPSDRKQMSRDLMNALLQFPTAQRTDGVNGRTTDVIVFPPGADVPVASPPPDEAP